MPNHSPDADILTLLPVWAGLLLLLVSVGVLFVLKSSIGGWFSQQFEISNSWITLKTSMLALLFILGFLLLLSGMVYRCYVTNPDLQVKLAAQSAKTEQLEKELREGGKFSVRAYFTFPKGVDTSRLETGSLRCRYLLSTKDPAGEEDWITVPTEVGTSTDDVSCVIQNIKRSDAIERLDVLMLQKNGLKPKPLGFLKNINLFEPTFELEEPRR